MKPYLLLVVMCLTHFTTNAQRICSTEEYVKNYFVPNTKNSFVENKIPPRDTIPNEIITIPVVVHVLFNNQAQNITTAQVLSQIDVLNKDFRLLNTDKSLAPEIFKSLSADSKIMFCLAKVDPEGHATSGINRKYTTKEYFMADDDIKFTSKGGVDAWDSERYLNIWVCSVFGRVLGYATPPGGDPLKDGVVINSSAFGTVGYLQSGFKKGRTATHEIAHWMGLKHIWGDDLCGDDEVDDTPKQKSYNFNCPVFPRVTNCSKDSSGDMFMNFMDLTSDACMNMFTNGQKMKMRGLFALGAYRNSFLRSYQCDSSLASKGPLPIDTIPVAVPEDIISIYPNPATEYVIVHANQLTTLKGKTAVIISAQGQQLFQQVLQSSTEKILIRQLPPGIYFLSIGDKEGKKNFKFIKM